MISTKVKQYFPWFLVQIWQQVEPFVTLPKEPR